LSSRHLTKYGDKSFTSDDATGGPQRDRSAIDPPGEGVEAATAAAAAAASSEG
jgi:hypothetical protein